MVEKILEIPKLEITNSDKITQRAEETTFDWAELLDTSQFFMPAEIFMKYYTIR